MNAAKQNPKMHAFIQIIHFDIQSPRIFARINSDLIPVKHSIRFIKINKNMLFPNDENLSKSGNGFARTTNHKFKDASERFTLGSRHDYQKQYAHIYSERLNEMRPLLAEKATQKWGKLL